MDNKCVLLSLESIEQRLDNPKAYYVFYEFFYRAAVGESKWKYCMDNLDMRFGNDTTEAFALLLFANNYKAWLFQENNTQPSRKFGVQMLYPTWAELMFCNDLP